MLVSKPVYNLMLIMTCLFFFFKENVPVNLSVEEQNVKNSILRLNDRLNGKL